MQLGFVWMFIVLFVLVAIIFCSVCYLIATLGGWKAIAEAYPDRFQDASVQSWRFQSLGIIGNRFLPANYNNMITISVGDGGIRFAPWPPVWAGHAPFFVPWDDVKLSEGRRIFWTRELEMAFSKLPRYRVRISMKLASKIARSAKGRWPRLATDPT